MSEKDKIKGGDKMNKQKENTFKARRDKIFRRSVYITWAAITIGISGILIYNHNRDRDNYNHPQNRYNTFQKSNIAANPDSARKMIQLEYAADSTKDVHEMDFYIAHRIEATKEDRDRKLAGIDSVVATYEKRGK